MKELSRLGKPLFAMFILCGFLMIDVMPLCAQTANNARRAQRRNDLLAIPEVSRDKVICFALYTVNDRVLKLTAQLYPLNDDESRTVRLELMQDGQWREATRTEVIEDGWTAPFRIENWDDTKDVRYRVAHGKEAFYEGLVRHNPVEKDELVVAGFTGNSINPSHGGDISREDIIENIKSIDADMLFFSGDQVYDHNRHYAAWLKFGRDFGEIIKDRPTITIPDDHDVGQANLWGHGGRKSNTGAGHDGGYFKPVEYVKQVERAQTSHLPDPYDPTPIDQGIGVYYTSMTWGNVSFAILEDRKFKTGPDGMIPKQGPRPDHILNPEYDPKSVDVPEARLLGDRQLAFLDQWTQDWSDAKLKVAMSQTIFCGGAHIHGKVGGRLHADLDSNGWPQTGRNKAIAALRKGFVVHYAGDQHLATIFHHGIDEARDSIYSFCVPSIANLYLRWWDPLEPGKNRNAGDPPHLGDHHDGFGNLVTCVAVANPSREPASGDKLTTRAAGFGIMRLNTKTRDITMECWPRNVDISSPDAEQHQGWPVTINQLDNDGRAPVAYLPNLVVRGAEDPVVQVVDQQSGEIVYTLRIKGNEFQPKVFRKGKHTIHVTADGEKRSYQDIDAIAEGAEAELKVDF